MVLKALDTKMIVKEMDEQTKKFNRYLPSVRSLPFLLLKEHQRLDGREEPVAGWLARPSTGCAIKFQALQQRTMGQVGQESEGYPRPRFKAAVQCSGQPS